MAELFGCERVTELMEQILETLQEYERQTDSMIWKRYRKVLSPETSSSRTLRI